MANRIDPRRAKLHRCYTVEEAARLFGVHRNTVRNWQKAGLAAIDTVKPALIRGVTLRAFLEGRRKAARHPCPPGTLYCFKCRAARAPALGMADFEARETGAGNLKALCAVCETVMHRRTRESDLSAVLPETAIWIIAAECAGGAAPRSSRNPPCAEAPEPGPGDNGERRRTHHSTGVAAVHAGRRPATALDGGHLVERINPSPNCAEGRPR